MYFLNFIVRTIHISYIALFFLVFYSTRIWLQGLEAVLDKAVELEDGKKVSGFVKLV